MDTPVQTIPTVETQIPETPQVPQNPKDNHGITIAAMALFVLLSLGVIVFLYYQNQQLKDILANYQTPTVSSTPTPVATIDPTASWKTYTNNKYGLDFSFLYPTDFNIKRDPETSWDSPAMKNFVGMSIELTPTNKYKFQDLILSITKTDKSLDEYVKNYTSSNYTTPKTKTRESLTIAEWIGSYKNAPTHYLSFVSNGYIYSFGLVAIDDVTSFGTENSKLLDQILSTFKFTEVTNSATPIATQRACTMEAKICPNGSSVGRTGPNCEFAPCP